MAQIIELHGSQSETTGDNPSAELRYKILDTDDRNIAQGLLRAFAPLTYLLNSGQTVVRQTAHIEPAGHDWWWGEAKYGRRQQKDTNQSRFTFDTTGGMTHITQSLATSREGPAPGGPFGAPDFQGAIGVTNGKDVEGVDIYSPVFKWTETHYLPLAWVNDAYKLIVKHLTTRTNDAGWRNHAAGEVLFLGAVGSQRGEEDWEITYHFVAGENIQWKVGNLNPINKEAWHYGWVLYEYSEDANKLISTPHSVYVEQVYEKGSFLALSIGA